MPATWWAQLRRGPTFMYLALLTCWSVTVFFAFSSKSRNPARALGGPLLGAPAPWRRHVVRFPRHFAGLGVRCPPLVLRDQRLGSFCACQRPPSIANQRRSASLIAVIFFCGGSRSFQSVTFFRVFVQVQKRRESIGRASSRCSCTMAEARGTIPAAGLGVCCPAL